MAVSDEKLYELCYLRDSVAEILDSILKVSKLCDEKEDGYPEEVLESIKGCREKLGKMWELCDSAEDLVIGAVDLASRG